MSESSTPLPLPTSHHLPALHTADTKERRRAYEQRILQVKHSTFTPLIFSTSGGDGDPPPRLPSRDWPASLPPSWDNPTVQPSDSSDARLGSPLYNQESCACVVQDCSSMPLSKPSASRSTHLTSSARRCACFD